MGEHPILMRGWQLRVLAVLCLGGALAVVGAAEPPVIAQEGTQFTVFVNADQALGVDWPQGAAVTLSIDDPFTSLSPDFTATESVGAESYVRFAFEDEFDVRPGHVVTMDDGQTLISHVVQTVEVSGVDVAADTVSGTADPGDMIEVIIYPEFGGEFVVVETQPDGTWVAPFAAIRDLVPGIAGGAYENDPDPGVSAGTIFGWQAPEDPVSCTVEGTEGNDVLRGTRGPDILCGFGGNDRLYGFGGDDVLLGGDGQDRLFGGWGDDVLDGGPGIDRCIAGSGQDTIENCER